MLTLVVKSVESYDESQRKFVMIGEDYTLQMEHSLVSLSKWEQIYEKPFLGKDEKSPDEILGYFKCMTLTPDVPDEVWQRLSAENLKEIDAYINRKMTASWVNETNKARGTNEVITAELIYYWMSAFNIAPEYREWHLNQLIMLIKIHNKKQSKPEKQNTKDAARTRAELNAARRKQFESSG